MAAADHDRRFLTRTDPVMNDPDNQPRDHESTRPGWPERHVNLIVGLLIAACAGSLVAELLFSPFFDKKHPAHFRIENVFGYQAVIGFVAFVTVVFLGRALRRIVQRPEDYYDQ